MDDFNLELNKSLDDEEAIADYLQGAMKLHNEHYLHHCQVIAAEVRTHILEAEEGTPQ